MKLELSRVNPEDPGKDLDDIVRIMFDVFGGQGLLQALFGVDDTKARVKAKVELLEAMATDPTDIWLKVTDAESGKLIGAGNWKVVPTLRTKEQLETKVDYFDTEEDKAAAKEIIDDFLSRRYKYVDGPHIRKYPDSVDPFFIGVDNLCSRPVPKVIISLLLLSLSAR